jgi:hypothetical protein
VKCKFNSLSKKLKTAFFKHYLSWNCLFISFTKILKNFPSFRFLQFFTIYPRILT